MTTTNRLNVNELSDELITSIKAVFKDKVVEITVMEAIDETDFCCLQKKIKSTWSNLNPHSNKAKELHLLFKS